MNPGTVHPGHAPGGEAALAGRPLRWWSRAQLESLGRSLAAPWRQWQVAWGIEWPTAQAVPCAVAHEATWPEPVQWQVLGIRGDALAWVGNPAAGCEAVRAALFGDTGGAAGDSADGIAARVSRKAWQAALSCMAHALLLDTPAQGGPHPGGLPGASLMRPWSGAVQMLLPLPGGKLPLLLGPACVEAWLARPGAELRRNTPTDGRGRAALVPVSRALAGLPLEFRAELDGCELDLGTLQSLRIGDIVRLPHSLDAPLRMAGAGHAAMCGAYLGQRAGAKAVELARAATP